MTSTVTYHVVDSPEPPVEPSIEVTGLERDRDEGTATLTIATNLPGALRIEKTNKVRGFGPVQLNRAGNGELEVVARDKAAKKLDRTGRVTVNPLNTPRNSRWRINRGSARTSGEGPAHRRGPGDARGVRRSPRPSVPRGASA